MAVAAIIFSIVPPSLYGACRLHEPSCRCCRASHCRPHSTDFSVPLPPYLLRSIRLEPSLRPSASPIGPGAIELPNGLSGSLIATSGGVANGSLTCGRCCGVITVSRSSASNSTLNSGSASGSPRSSAVTVASSEMLLGSLGQMNHNPSTISTSM